MDLGTRTGPDEIPTHQAVMSNQKMKLPVWLLVNKALLNLLNILAPALANSFSFSGLKNISSNPHNPVRTAGGGFLIHPAIQNFWSLVKGCPTDGAWGEKERGGSRASAWSACYLGM